jgi:hypothetical protein
LEKLELTKTNGSYFRNLDDFEEALKSNKTIMTVEVGSAFLNSLEDSSSLMEAVGHLEQLETLKITAREDHRWGGAESLSWLAGDLTHATRLVFCENAPF